MSETDEREAERAYAEADALLRSRMRIGQTWTAASTSRPEQGRYPDFLVIGAQKAGTTWLYRNMNYHPDVWLPPIKEVNYFNEIYLPSSTGWESADRLAEALEARKGYDALQRLTIKQQTKQNAVRTIQENALDDEWYGRIFGHAGDDLLCGDITPEYALLPRVAIARLLRMNPAAKAIYVLRDPIERIWSNARMTAYRSGEDAPEYFLGEAHWHVMLGRSNYPATIARWSGIFPKEQFITLSFDKLADSPLSFLKEFCEAIGLSFDARFFPLAHSMVREGPSTEIPDHLLSILRDRMRFIYDELLQWVPEIAAPWVRKHYG